MPMKIWAFSLASLNHLEYAFYVQKKNERKLTSTQTQSRTRSWNHWNSVIYIETLENCIFRMINTEQQKRWCETWTLENSLDSGTVQNNNTTTTNNCIVIACRWMTWLHLKSKMCLISNLKRISCVWWNDWGINRWLRRNIRDGVQTVCIKFSIRLKQCIFLDVSIYCKSLSMFFKANYCLLFCHFIHTIYNVNTHWNEIVFQLREKDRRQKVRCMRKKGNGVKWKTNASKCGHTF